MQSCKTQTGMRDVVSVKKYTFDQQRKRYEYSLVKT